MLVSALVHLGLVGVLVEARGWAPVRPPALLAQLVEPDAAPTPPARAPKAVVRPPRPLIAPRPLETPLPVESPTPSAPPPEPARPAATEPSPAPEPATPPTAATDPAVVAGPPLAEVPQPSGGSAVATPAEPGPGAFAAAPGSTTSPPAPAATREPLAAAVPPDGVTRRATPRGGYQHRPAYPSSARRLGIQGTTLLGVLIAVDGRVADVLVKQSAGHPDLDRAAIDAVRRWRFEPARRGDDAVAMWVLLPVEFRLR